MNRLLCKMFGHFRNGRRVRRSHEGWRTSCIICREPLIRVSQGDWQPYARRVTPVADQLDFLGQLDRSPSCSRAPTK